MKAHKVIIIVVGVPIVMLMTLVVVQQVLSYKNFKAEYDNRNLVASDLSYLDNEFEKLHPTTGQAITIESLAPDPTHLNEPRSNYVFIDHDSPDGTQPSIRIDGPNYQGILYRGTLNQGQPMHITHHGFLQNGDPKMPSSFDRWHRSESQEPKNESSAPAGATDSPTSGLKGQENKAQGK